MTGGHVGAAHFQGLIQHQTEFQPPVAENAGVRGQALLVAFDEPADDQSLKVLPQIQHAVVKAQPPGHASGIGLIVGVVWVYLTGFSDIAPFCDVYTWDAVREAIINLVGILVGALVAVGIFLYAVMKS